MPRSAVPFHVHSIHFAYPGSEAIPLRDDETLGFLGDKPEWTDHTQGDPAAFVRRARPRILVRFKCQSSTRRKATGWWTIGAAGGTTPGITPRRVKLTFGRDGRSAPLPFRLDGRLPDILGRVSPTWEWTARRGNSVLPLGSSSHEILLAWKRPIDPTLWASPREPRGGPHWAPNSAWTYKKLMLWSTVLAAGKKHPKEICDALLSQLSGLGLGYAIPAYTVLGMFYAGGGYCAGWYRMFQAMAGAHGVLLERRTYAIDWQPAPNGESRWCAIVVDAPGVHRTEPQENASLFHDVVRRPLHTSSVRTRTVRRYRFWGCPDLMADGHCINFLRYGNRWYLYDACFNTAPVQMKGFRLPPPNSLQSVPVEKLGNFKEDYLAVSVPFLLGTLYHRGKLYETRHPDSRDKLFPSQSTKNGLSVRTALVPSPTGAVRFYWTT